MNCRERGGSGRKTDVPGSKRQNENRRSGERRGSGGEKMLEGRRTADDHRDRRNNLKTDASSGRQAHARAVYEEVRKDQRRHQRTGLTAKTNPLWRCGYLPMEDMNCFSEERAAMSMRLKR